MYKASIIITSYQAEDSIANAIYSVLNTPRRNELEVIVVDDCSNDCTVEIVSDICQKYSNVKLIVMPENTGGPSVPRNKGIECATGLYISTLDDDDTYEIDNYFQVLDYALENDLDFVKGYLWVHKNSHTSIANRLRTIPNGYEETIKEIVKNHSLMDYVVKREIVEKNNIQYPNDLKIGEDSVFITSLLANSQNVAYIDIAYLHHNKTPIAIDNLSSTQSWGDREILNQIKAWKLARKNLLQVGLDYYQLRLAAGFRNLLLSVVRFSNGISEFCFNELQVFAKETQAIIKGQLVLAERYAELYKTILSDTYEEYCKVSKRRLLIAGYDLKFILPVVSYLQDKYEIKIDEWTGHNSHNEKQSKDCLAWADIIWCEWLLGNAVYYAKHKANYQFLVIRAHRFELTREFGRQIDYSKVNTVFAVSYYFFELFAKQFNIPRSKMKLLSNYVDTKIYAEQQNSGSVFDLAMVGILPSRKGYRRALELLKELVDINPQYVLHICGQLPNEVPWIANDKNEKAYYDDCQQFINDNNLASNVVFEGFKPRETLYQNIGIVLSLSDSDGIPESCHLAPAEGACAGAVGLLLNWPGVEFVYPEDVVYSDMQEIREIIVKMSEQSDCYRQKQAALQRYVMDNYDIDVFLEKLDNYLLQVRVMG